MWKLRNQKIQLFMFILDHLGSSWVILDHQHQHNSKMTFICANIAPHQTRFNLILSPCWALNRTKIKTNTDKPKPRILCKIQYERHLGHGRGAIFLPIYCDLDRSYFDHRKMIKIRAIKIAINGQEDSSRRQL